MDYGIEIIEKKIKELIVNELNRTGLLFRIFSRIKDDTSIKDKFSRKNYGEGTTKMQDLIGFRITTYFNDDVKIVVDLCERIFTKLELIYDEPDTEVFRPLRKNMICRFPIEQGEIFKELQINNRYYQLIDDTFEIQFRTTLSEGWHEVDHLMRYKCQADWCELTNESRMLNGIYATLETNDQALKALFEDIAYLHYKSKKWEAMLRNKLRLRFSLQKLDEDLVNYFNTDLSIGRDLFKLNRDIAIRTYINSIVSFPTTFDNWIYFLNYFFLNDAFIKSKTPEFLIEEFKLSQNI